MNYKNLYTDLHNKIYHWYFRNYYVLRFWFWWLVVVLVLGLSGFGAYYMTTEYVEADAKVSKAEAKNEELLAVLNGKLAMVDTEHGSRYAVVERVLWEVR